MAGKTYQHEELLQLVAQSNAPRTKTRCKYCLDPNLEWVSFQNPGETKVHWLLVGVTNGGKLYHHHCKESIAAYLAQKESKIAALYGGKKGT